MSGFNRRRRASDADQGIDQKSLHRASLNAEMIADLIKRHPSEPVQQKDVSRPTRQPQDRPQQGSATVVGLVS